MGRLVLKAGRSAPADRLKIFISYSRKDAAAADSLVDALAARGYDVTIDRRSLPFGERWKNELTEFIRVCDTVVWLISQHSIRSEWVNWELDEVARRNKRLVPIMIDATPRDTLPRQLGEIHVLPLEGQFSLDRDLDLLVRVLETDGPWLKEASRLADRAHEWLAKDRAAALLFRGAALQAAERWTQRRSARAPAPSQEVLDLILASRQADTRRQRWWTGGIAAAGLAALAVAGYALTMRQAALVGEAKAVAEEQRAIGERDRALATTSRILARDSQSALARKDPVKALLIALEGLPDAPGDRPLVWQAETAANGALFEWRHRRRITAPDHWDNWKPISNADGGIAIGRLPDETVLWDTRTGAEIAHYKGGTIENGARINEGATKLYVHDGSGKTEIVDLRSRAVTALSVPGAAFEIARFSRDGDRLLTTHDDKKARLWDTASGSIVQTFDMASQLVVNLLLSDDGRTAVAETEEHELFVFDDVNATARCRIPIPPQSLDWTTWFFALSDRRLVTASLQRLDARQRGSVAASVWNLDSCAPSPSLAGFGDQDTSDKPAEVGFGLALSSVELLSNGSRLVLSKIAREEFVPNLMRKAAVGVWDLESQAVIARFDDALDYTISGDNVIVAHTPSSTIMVSDLGGRKVELEGTDGGLIDIETIIPNKDGTRIALKSRDSALSDFSPGLWDATTGRRLTTLTEPGAKFQPMAFSPDGRYLLTLSSKDNSYQLRDAITGDVAAVLDAGESNGQGYEFSPDGRMLFTSADGKSWEVFSVEADVRAPLLQPDAKGIGFSADGKFVLGQALDNAAVFEIFAWDSATGARALLAKPAIEALRSGRQGGFPDGEYYVAQKREAVEAASQHKNQSETDAQASDPEQPESSEPSAPGMDELDRLLGIGKPEPSSTPGKASDLAFLVRVGAEQEHWHWLFGSDGRVRMVRPQAPPSKPLVPMNRLSFATEGYFYAIVGLPSSHRSFEDFDYVDMAFSPDGTRVVTIWKEHNKGRGETRTLRLWQQGRDEPVVEFRSTFGRQAAGAKFDPTGRRLLVRYDDGTIRVLDASTLDEVARIAPRDGDNSGYEVSADGTRILTRNSNADYRKMTLADKSWLRVWFIEPTPEALVARARQLVPRCLSPVEREQELQLPPAPPRWCITGPAGEKEPNAWQPKWPYRSPVWREWQLARDKGDDPPLPKME